MGTKFNEAQDLLKDKLGTDHNSARVRSKTSSSKTGDHNYEARYSYFSLGNANLSVAMTEEDGTLYIRLSGDDGRGSVFCTFTSTSHSKDDLVSLLNEELDIELSED
jgi:hypothetical protein